MKNLIANYIKKLRENVHIKDYVNKLKNNENIKKLISKIKNNENIIKLVNKIKQNQYVNKYLSDFGKSKYFMPAVTIAICFVLSIGTTAVLKAATPKKIVDKNSVGINEAEIDFFNGKYDEAIAEYTKMQESDPWPIWNAKIAEIYSVKGEFVKSNEMLQKVFQARNKVVDTKNEKIDNIKDKDRELVNYITFTEFMNGEYKKAQEYGELFLLDYPDNKKLLKTMFTVYVANGDKNKAKEILKNYPKGESTANDLATLARMNALVDNLDESFSLLKAAWDKDKNEVEIFNVIEQIADYNKNDALDKISKLQKKDPNEAVYKMWTAKIYSMSKESTDKANQLVDQMKNEEAGNINLNYIKANIYDNLDNKDKLNEVLEEIVKSDKESANAYNAEAWIDYNSENYDEAYKKCEKSIVTDRNDSENYVFLMPQIMEKKDNCAAAEAYFRTALYNEPFDYETMLKTAEYYGNTIKSSSKALYYYDLVSKINPNDAEAYYNMALINVSNKREDEAIPLLKKSISIDDKEKKYHRALGTVYMNKEKNEDAIKEIRNAYNLDNKDVKTLNNAGCYYVSVEGDISRGLVNLKAAYDGINEKTSKEDKDAITENYNRIKSLSDTYNKKNGAALKVPDLKLFY